MAKRLFFAGAEQTIPFESGPYSLLIIAFTILVAFVVPFIRVIPRNERRVYVNKWTGNYVLKRPYWTLVFPHLDPVPNTAFESFREFPAPYSRPLVIDPPKVELRTSDGVHATIDIKVEMVVLEYTAEDIAKAVGEGATGSFEKRAKERINAWLTLRVSKLNSSHLRDFAHVLRVLNEPDTVADLDRELKPFFFKTNRVFIDYGGIALSQEYLNTVGARIRLEGQAELQDMEAKTQLKQVQTAMEILKMRTEAENNAREARMEKMASLYSSLVSKGMTPDQAVKVIVTDRMAEAMEHRSPHGRDMLLHPFGANVPGGDNLAAQ